MNTKDLEFLRAMRATRLERLEVQRKFEDELTELLDRIGREGVRPEDVERVRQMVYLNHDSCDRIVREMIRRMS